MLCDALRAADCQRALLLDHVVARTSFDSDEWRLLVDPRFEEKLVDVVGLYLNPPEQAVSERPNRGADLRTERAFEIVASFAQQS